MRGRPSLLHYAIVRGRYLLLVQDMGEERRDTMLRRDALRRRLLLSALDSQHAWTIDDVVRMTIGTYVAKYQWANADIRTFMLADLKSLASLGYVEETRIGRWILKPEYCLRYGSGK